MSEIFREQVKILSNEKLSAGVYSLELETKNIAKNAKAGQFVTVYCKDSSRLLPRPISLCEIDSKKNTIRLVFRTVGAGTKELADYKAGEELTVMGPLGNGYDLDKFDANKKALIIGGGIGIPPMLQVAKDAKCQKEIVAGYRNKNELFLYKDLEVVAKVHVATDDGSFETKGTVIDAIKEKSLQADVVFACGPMPMLKALKMYCENNNIECYISLEESMACGIGACLGCVTKTKKKDHHLNVNNTRICTEGPVFDAREVEI